MAAAGDGEFYRKLIELDPDGLAASLDDAGIGVWYLDFDEDVQHYNSYLLDLFGFGRDEIISRDDAFRRLVHPDDIEEARELAEQRLTSKVGGPVPGRFRDARGRYISCVAHGTPILGEDGEVVRLIGVLRNRDELERAEERMREAERMANLGHWSVSLPDNTLTWSDGTFEIYGYEPGSFVPTVEFAQSRYAEGEADRLLDVVGAAIASTRRFSFRSRIISGDDTEKHVNVIGRVEVDADGAPIGYSGVVQDITDDVLREQQVRQSQKMEAIGTMTGGAAHDFNNLLAVILGNLELLRDRVDDPDLVDHCDAAISAALNGADLTRSMLSFARRAQLNPSVVDLNDIVRGLSRWTHRTLSATVDTEISLMAGLWKTEIDPASTESALLNLILNARDAMPGGGKLTIETANVRIDEDYIASRNEDVEPGRYVMLAVSDTGDGVPPDDLDQIFEPFFSTKSTGTGLGLSMVQGFVKQSNGAIRVYSEPGVGTTFKLYFPARDGPETVPDTALATAVSDAATGAHILVAEDEPDVLAVLVKMLTEAGYRVTRAASGDDARVIFERDPTIDLLITDIVMPGRLQGTDLAREARGRRPSLPAIFMSGYANEATVHGNGLRPDDIRLMKPVRRADLLHAITTALRRAEELGE